MKTVINTTKMSMSSNKVQNLSPLTSPLSPSKKMSLWQQVSLVFFTVSGGAYGLETLVGTVGPKLALLLVILLPLFWAIPIALMTAELSTAIPEEGGFYVWVKKGLGPFWGFQEGWWTLCYTAVDLALYPVLFVTYLSFFFPLLNSPEYYFIRWCVSLVFILAGFLFNLRGSQAVGKNALFSLCVVSFPFLLLILWGCYSGDWQKLSEAYHQPENFDDLSKVAAGLAVVLWSYCGWDNASTYVNEVENPQKNCPKSMGMALIIIMASYILPLLAGFKATIIPSDWGNSSGWPAIAEMLGGHVLGWIIALAAILSAWAMYNSQLYYISKLPTAMANDGILPKVLAKKSKNGVPFIALSVMVLCSAVFSSLSLGKLLVVDILFYALGLSLEFLALIALRIKEPGLKRPFKIPLGIGGLVVISAMPLFLAGVVANFSTQGSGSMVQLGIVAIGIVFGMILYYYQVHHGVELQHSELP